MNPIREDHAVILLGGGKPERQILEFARLAKILVCADRGAKHALAYNLRMDAVVGDFDSLTPQMLEECRDRGAKIVHMPDQDRNDFEKALEYLATIATGPVAVLGMTGLRHDHTLTNFSVMLRWTDRFQTLTAYDSFGSYRFLTPKRRSWTFDGPIGTQLSLVPFGTATGVTTTNMKYPLTNEELALGHREGLSNAVAASPCSIQIEGGALLIAQLDLPRLRKK